MADVAGTGRAGSKAAALAPSSWKGAALVQDLSVLTPPLLMCAAVLFAVGAFLRHEMSKKRPETDEQEPAEPIAPPSAPEETGNNAAGTDASESTPRKH
jgi:hypothetical protein